MLFQASGDLIFRSEKDIEPLFEECHMDASNVIFEAESIGRAFEESNPNCYYLVEEAYDEEGFYIRVLDLEAI